MFYVNYISKRSYLKKIINDTQKDLYTEFHLIVYSKIVNILMKSGSYPPPQKEEWMQ